MRLRKYKFYILKQILNNKSFYSPLKFKLFLSTKEGNSPVFKITFKKQIKREKTCLNKGVPSSKAKYDKFSNNEKYCEGKVEIESLKQLVKKIWN